MTAQPRKLQGLDILAQVQAPPSGDGPICLPLSQIQPDPNQPRKFFDADQIASLADYFKSHGAEGVVLHVRSQSVSDLYLLVAGERRFRALQQAGIEQVYCIVQDWDDRQALTFGLVENLKREPLSELEVVEGLLQLLQQLHHQPLDWVLKHLGSITHGDYRRTGSPEETLTFQILQELELSASLVRQYLKLRLMPEPLKQAHLKGRLAWSKALVMARLKQEALWQPLLEETLSQNLSKAEIEQRVRQLQLSKQASKRSLPHHPLQRKATTVLSKLRQNQNWEKLTTNHKSQKRLESLLLEIEALINAS